MADVDETVIEETIEEEPMEVFGGAAPVEETTPEVASAPPQPERKQRKPRAKAPPPSRIEAPADAPTPEPPSSKCRGRPLGSKNRVPDAPPLPPTADEIANRMLDIIAERQSGRRHAQKQLYESWLQ